MENRTVEINQAIDAGKDILRIANRALDYLNGAQTWGFIDMFSRGGLISGLVKHSKMNSAEDTMNELRIAINRFNSELNDIKVYGYVEGVDFDGFMRFIDIFCDNFFIDFLAISRISSSKERIKNLIYEVQNIMNRLETSK